MNMKFFAMMTDAEFEAFLTARFDDFETGENKEFSFLSNAEYMRFVLERFNDFNSDI